MKNTFLKNGKALLLVAFVFGAFGQKNSTASVVKPKVVKTEYPLNCTFTGNREEKCNFILNGGAATADGCKNGGSSCSVWI